MNVFTFLIFQFGHAMLFLDDSIHNPFPSFLSNAGKLEPKRTTGHLFLAQIKKGMWRRKIALFWGDWDNMTFSHSSFSISTPI